MAPTAPAVRLSDLPGLLRIGHDASQHVRINDMRKRCRVARQSGQAPVYSLLFLPGEEVRVERPARFARGPGMLVDLPADLPDIEPHQLRGRIDARVVPNGA